VFLLILQIQADLKMKNPGFVSFAISIILFMSGCQTVQEVTPKTSAQLVEESQIALNSGKRETAVALLESASKTNPSDAKPWLKQAQLHFDADNFPAAIQAADEAMKRDPANKEAKAIAVVSSLRVAIRALADMNQDGLLRGSSRSEAERLARALRETLAQDQLIPIEESKSSSSKQAQKKLPSGTAKPSITASSVPASNTPAKTTVQAPSAAGAGTGSPFSTLK
jgi:tetratricopeptide (TPR) repeat protein